MVCPAKALDEPSSDFMVSGLAQGLTRVRE